MQLITILSQIRGKNLSQIRGQTLSLTLGQTLSHILCRILGWIRIILSLKNAGVVRIEFLPRDVFYEVLTKFGHLYNDSVKVLTKCCFLHTCQLSCIVFVHFHSKSLPVFFH